MLCCGKSDKKARLQRLASSERRPEESPLRKTQKSAPSSQLQSPATEQTPLLRQSDGKQSGNSSIPRDIAQSRRSSKMKPIGTAGTSRDSPRASPRKPRKAEKNAQTSSKVATSEITTQQSDSSDIQTVEILKRPGQSLGFYIREGNGYDQNDGVFISRIAPGSVVERNGLLRVGDEILTINSVDVSRMSLDDVVILMSIPKRLVLQIRTRMRSATSSGKNASWPSLHSLQPPDEPPVVVLKNRARANSSSAVEMTEKGSQEFTGSHVDSRFYAEHSPYTTYNRSTFTQPLTFDRTLFGDDSGDSGLSSENSGCSAPGKDAQVVSPQERISQPLDIKQYAIDSRNFPQQRISPREAPNVVYRSPLATRRNPYVPVEYAYDPEVARYTHARSSSDVLGYLSPHHLGQYEPAERQGYPGEARMGYDNRSSPQYTLPNNPMYARIRHLSPEHYNSDSEAPISRIAGDESAAARELQALERQHAHISRLLAMDERFHSLSHVLPQHATGRGSPSVYPSGGATGGAPRFNRFTALSLDQKAPPPIPPHSSAHQPASNVLGSPRRLTHDSFSSQEYQNWLVSQLQHTGQTLPPNFTMHPMQHTQMPRPDLTFPRQQHQQHTSGHASQHHTPVLHPRVTRKLSADSLMDYRTYQLDDDSSSNSTHNAMLTNHRSHKSSTGNLSDIGASLATGTLTKPVRPQKHSVDAEGKSILSPASTRLKDLQLARKPLQIRTEEFTTYQPDTEDRKAKYEKSLDGIIAIHILCGHGLKSSRTVLRDLYCVIEVDNVNKARTMIRTGAINFDWDEAFDVDLENARELSFQVYSWDPNTRHRLCYSCTVGLHNLIHTNAQKIALKLEPKGILYLVLDYQDPSRCLQRTPATKSNVLVGVDVENLVAIEKSGESVPILVRKCIEEVDLRGLEHVGIYRLCGSAKRKKQLKEEFEKNARAVELGHQSVSDINVVTGVLKDFFRELPEPIFTNSLYRMLVDALSVRTPADPDGSAKLMLSILECLPKANQETLSLLLEHLKRVASRCEVNKMTTANLAICFGPLLLCPSPASCGASGHAALDFKKQIEVLKYLLDIWPEYRESGLPLSSDTLLSQSSSSTGHSDNTSGSTVRRRPTTQPD